MRCWERAVRNKTEEEDRGKERASLPQEVRERHSGKITQTEGEPAYEEEQVSLPIRGKSEAPPPLQEGGHGTAEARGPLQLQRPVGTRLS